MLFLERAYSLNVYEILRVFVLHYTDGLSGSHISLSPKCMSDKLEVNFYFDSIAEITTYQQYR